MEISKSCNQDPKPHRFTTNSILKPNRKISLSSLLNEQKTQDQGKKFRQHLRVKRRTRSDQIQRPQLDLKRPSIIHGYELDQDYRSTLSRQDSGSGSLCERSRFDIKSPAQRQAYSKAKFTSLQELFSNSKLHTTKNKTVTQSAMNFKFWSSDQKRQSE